MAGVSSSTSGPGQDVVAELELSDIRVSANVAGESELDAVHVCAKATERTGALASETRFR